MVKVWDFWSKYYDRLWVQQLSLRPTRLAIRNIVNFIQKNMYPEGKKYFLDIGCGTGQLLDEVRRRFSIFKYIGVDISAKMLQRAKQKGLEVILSDAQNNLPFQEESFFLITSTHAIPYLKDVEAFFKQVNSLLVSGGYFIVACANTDTFWDRIVGMGIKLTVFHGRYHPSSDIERWGYRAGFSLKLKRKIVGFPFFSITIFVWKKEGEN